MGGGLDRAAGARETERVVGWWWFGGGGGSSRTREGETRGKGGGERQTDIVCLYAC